ncbi:deoxyribose-phosphate aldolase [Tindallia californiensis]|uniref:Deoxyribose-phosphate aldolase n=1 Tax=Tindallia californiensis TaxID=159292 RepID=A0A1H3IKW4_9FIRM|nr:deoxyribose-phosphate aldolase [Tindallia californiensis]SDY28416.1 deoxyribose-phosphate aldolase [Tindallia californiensis]
MRQKIIEWKNALEKELKVEIPDLWNESTEKKLEETGRIADMIDHTLLKPEAGKKDYITLFEEAKHYEVHSVCIPPCRVKLAVNELEGTSVNVCTVIGFPLGYQSMETKIFEAKKCIADGAQEIDMVLNISALKSGEYIEVFNEINNIKKAIGPERILKVIIETALLEEKEKYIAGWIARVAGADFVKTSTGFAKEGATAEDVRLLRSIAGTVMGVKASGGIRDYEKAMEMIGAGANRLGLSSAVAVLENKKRIPSTDLY